MKKTLLSIAAAVAISLGVAGAANTASADVTPAVATAQSDVTGANASHRIRIRIRHGYYGYYGYNRYGYRYIGSYRHCKRLLRKWKVYGSWYAKRQFYRLRCARYFY